MILDTIRAIYKTNLSVKAGERVLVFTDMPTPSETIDAHDSCRRDGLRYIAMLTAEVGRSYTKKILYKEFQHRAVMEQSHRSNSGKPPLEGKLSGSSKKKGLLAPLLKKSSGQRH